MNNEERQKAILERKQRIQQQQTPMSKETKISLSFAALTAVIGFCLEYLPTREITQPTLVFAALGFILGCFSAMLFMNVASWFLDRQVTYRVNTERKKAEQLVEHQPITLVEQEQEKPLITNGFLAVHGNRMIRLPEGIDPDFFHRIHKARAAGKLTYLSLRKLDQEAQINRSNGDAKQVIDFLSQHQLIIKSSNSMYRWSVSGSRIFPSPKDASGRGQEGGGQSSTTTATTTYPPLATTSVGEVDSP